MAAPCRDFPEPRESRARGPGLLQALWLTSLIAIGSLPSHFAAHDTVAASPFLTPHAPILIDGNGDFTGSNGVRGGTGTQADPYVIEGWAVDASSADGIAIRNTTAAFTIRNVSASGGGPLYDGLSLINVANGRVQEALASENAEGISVEGSKNITIIAGEFTSNLDTGILLRSSMNISVVGNRVTGNSAYGIFLLDADAARLSANNVSGNREGIHLSSSAGAVLIENRMENNTGFGLYSYYSVSIAMSNNTIASNGEIGAVLFASRNATLRANTFISDGLSISGDPIHYTSHSITPDNLVNGQPLRFYKNTTGLRIEGVPLGALIVANATNVTATNLEIAETDVAILFGYVSGVLIADNNLSGNYEGISLGYTTNAIIANNTVSRNIAQGINLGLSSSIEVVDNLLVENGYGLYLFRSTGIAVHGNNFAGNTVQADDHRGPENSWDAGYPEGGNYWSDYSGPDNCSGPDQDVCPSPDGIGDLPYAIDADSRDRYPLLPPNTRPVAAFTLEPLAGRTTTVFTVDASTSSDLEDPASSLQVRWDWENDGMWDTPWQLAKTAQHRYEDPGWYTIRLEIRDTRGLTDSTTHTVTVAAPPPEEENGGQSLALIAGSAAAAGAAAAFLLYWIRFRRRRP